MFHGTIGRDIEEVIAVLRRAQDLATKHGVTLVLLGEKWGAGGRKMNPVSAAGLGARWGPWEYVARSPSHQGLKDRHIARIHPRTWRSLAYGPQPNHDDKTWKKMARVRVAAQFPKIQVASDDECEAILIGLVGTKLAEVGEALPAKVRAAMQGATSTAPGARKR